MEPLEQGQPASSRTVGRRRARALALAVVAYGGAGAALAASGAAQVVSRRLAAAVGRAKGTLPRVWQRPGQTEASEQAQRAPGLDAAIAYPHRHARLPHERTGPRAALDLRHAAQGFAGWAQFGRASFYADLLHGRPTSSGERYDREALTAAHRTLPIGTMVQVTNLHNQRSVTVRVNDRGPFIHNRLIDLSRAAAQRLGYVPHGTAPVRVEVVDARGAPGDAFDGVKPAP